MSSQKKKIKINNIGTFNNQPYSKADFFKFCRLDETYAIVFYQLDYISLATTDSDDSDIDSETEAIPVAKIAMDKSAYERLKKELISFEKILASEKEGEA